MAQPYDEEYWDEYLNEDIPSNRVAVYKEKQKGFTTEKYKKESGVWVRSNDPGKSKSRQFSTGVSRGAAVGIATAANKMLLNKGIGAGTGVGVDAKKVACDVRVAELAGVKVLNAGAEAKVGSASAGASATPIEAEAFAKATGAEASAHANLVEGVLGADAKAVAAEAQAKAGIGLKNLGAHAGQKPTTLSLCDLC